jgi:hypothetical protein
MTEIRVNGEQRHHDHCVRVPRTPSVIVSIPPTAYPSFKLEPEEVVVYYQAHEFTTAVLSREEGGEIVYRTVKDIPEEYADCEVGFDARLSPLTGSLEIVALVLYDSRPPLPADLEVAMMRADLAAIMEGLSDAEST